jgi:hypothetical protein
VELLLRETHDLVEKFFELIRAAPIGTRRAHTLSYNTIKMSFDTSNYLLIFSDGLVSSDEINKYPSHVDVENWSLQVAGEGVSA